MGRKRIPTVLKVVTGSHNKNAPDEPQPEGELDELAAPAMLTPDQKRIWDETVNDAPEGLLRHLDRNSLMVWVIACDTYMKAMLKVQELGMVEVTPVKRRTVKNKRGGVRIVESGGAVIQSNYLSIMNRQAVMMLKVASELGFSPTSRTRISLGGKGKENKFANNATRATKRA